MAKRKKAKTSSLLGGVFLAALLTLAVGLTQAGILPGWKDNAGQQNSAAAASQPFAAHFIDVGQGDCTLIKTPGGYVLIDAGESAYAKAVIAYLRKQGVSELAYVIATHPHSDHIGSLPEVLQVFSVQNVILPQLSENSIPTTRSYEQFLLAVKESGAKVLPATVGKSYQLGEATLEILGPVQQTEDLNNMSVITRFTFGGIAFLFTGDAEQAAEKALAESGQTLRANVFHAGHHGSKTSNSQNLLTLIQPELAIISCGRGNSYGHPHEQAVERLTQNGARILRTDICGWIVVGSDGKALYIHYENEPGEEAA